MRKTTRILILLTVVGALVASGAGLTISSDTQTQWSATGAGGSWQNSVLTWVHPSWPTISGAQWVWRTAETNPQEEYQDVPGGGWYFRRVFTLPREAVAISATIQVDADNAYQLYINGTYIGGNGAMSKDGPDNQEWQTVKSFQVTNLMPGANTVLIRALNYFSYGDYQSNPAGIIFKADVNYNLNVKIDIKPGCFPNSINLDTKGNVAVAILGSKDFDISTINRNTVVFAGASPLSTGQSVEDVNRDRYPDLVLHFSTQSLNLHARDIIATLTGKTNDGITFTGSDSVRIVTDKPDKPKNRS